MSQWQSIYQDDDEIKYKGVVSLVAYTTMCSYMLIPLDTNTPLSGFPVDIPNYGDRGWCEDLTASFWLHPTPTPPRPKPTLPHVL